MEQIVKMGSRALLNISSIGWLVALKIPKCHEAENAILWCGGNNGDCFFLDLKCPLVAVRNDCPFDGYGDLVGLFCGV